MTNVEARLRLIDALVKLSDAMTSVYTAANDYVDVTGESVTAKSPAWVNDYPVPDGRPAYHLELLTDNISRWTTRVVDDLRGYLTVEPAEMLEFVSSVVSNPSAILDDCSKIEVSFGGVTTHVALSDEVCSTMTNLVTNHGV